MCASRSNSIPSNTRDRFCCISNLTIRKKRLCFAGVSLRYILSRLTLTNMNIIPCLQKKNSRICLFAKLSDMLTNKTDRWWRAQRRISFVETLSRNDYISASRRKFALSIAAVPSPQLPRRTCRECRRSYLENRQGIEDRP